MVLTWDPAVLLAVLLVLGVLVGLSRGATA